MLWVIPKKLLHVYGDEESKSQKIHCKHKELHENPHGRKPQRKGDDNDDYNGLSGVLGFLGSIHRPLSRWKGFTICTSSVGWIRLQSPALFKYSTAYLKVG